MRHHRDWPQAPGQRGFSVPELLLIICFLLVLVAIAAPTYLRARGAAQHAVAMLHLASIRESQEHYRLTDPSQGYAQDIQQLDWGIECRERACRRGAYRFLIRTRLRNPILEYTAIAVPTTPAEDSIVCVTATGFRAGQAACYELQADCKPERVATLASASTDPPSDDTTSSPAGSECVSQ